jgi:hypothetical protein
MQVDEMRRFDAKRYNDLLGSLRMSDEALRQIRDNRQRFDARDKKLEPAWWQLRQTRLEKLKWAVK